MHGGVFCLSLSRIRCSGRTAFGQDDVSDRFATDDLVMQGHLSQAEADSVDDFLEAKPQGMGLTYVGDTARRYTEDNAIADEFSIDEDVAEWEGF